MSMLPPPPPSAVAAAAPATASAPHTAPPATPAASPARARLVGIDVVRGVALIGVVVMNYHGYLNGGSGADPSFAERVFDPFQGILSTRFAATFVTVAGIGIVLLTNRGRLTGDTARIRADRWRLCRRGVLLMVVGFVLNWAWNGTILYFYGAYFIVGAVIFTWRIRWLALLGALSALGATAVEWWAIGEYDAGHDVSWVFNTQALETRSPRGLLIDLALNGTHPLLPWLAFLTCGMIVGRKLPSVDAWRWKVVAVGVALVAVGYTASTMLRRAAGQDVTDLSEMRLDLLSRTDPFSRMILYVVVTLGSSLVAVLVISWLAERSPASRPVEVLSHAGQMTLTLYLLHVFVFNLVVNGLGWITPTGLDTALVFALAYWVFAILAGAWWHRNIGMGPAERFYRNFGG
jgi:uncharacterized protein